MNLEAVEFGGPVMTHGTPNMTLVEDPSKGLGERIRGVDDPRNVLQDDIAVLFPFLDGEVLDVNVPGPRGRPGGVDHQDGRLVVLVQLGWTELGETEFGKDGAKVLGGLGAGYGGNKFGLGRAGGDRWLQLGPIGDGRTTEREDDAGDGASSRDIVGMRGINVSGKDEWVDRLREDRKIGRKVGFKALFAADGKGRNCMGSPINEPPGLVLTQVTTEALEGRVVYLGGGS